MKNDLLMYVGSGLLVGSAVLGIAVAIAYILRAKIETFKYGVFYSVFAIVASIGYCLALIAFFFNFLGPKLQLPIFCSLVALGFLAGLIVMAVFIKKDNRRLFAILSLYTLFTVWLAPVFVWNMIYLFLSRVLQNKIPLLRLSHIRHRSSELGPFNDAFEVSISANSLLQLSLN